MQNAPRLRVDVSMVQIKRDLLLTDHLGDAVLAHETP